MHRIDQPGHVNNRFVNGNPETGQLPTRVGADWLNAVQEEIANTIVGAGIELDKTSNTQLREAIGELISNAVQNINPVTLTQVNQAIAAALNGLNIPTHETLTEWDGGVLS